MYSIAVGECLRMPRRGALASEASENALQHESFFGFCFFGQRGGEQRSRPKRRVPGRTAGTSSTARTATGAASRRHEARGGAADPKRRGGISRRREETRFKPDN
jgi:hypothetical protein